MTELFTRHHGNPILTAADWPYEVNTVFNAGVANVDDETLLLVRVEDRAGISHLAVATSADGVSGWEIDPKRALMPELGSEAERFGIEDPRVTRVGEEWLIVYTGYSTSGPLVCLAATPSECSAHDRERGQNCEAMSFGAVVQKPAAGTLPPHQSLPSCDGLLPLETLHAGVQTK